MRPRSEFRTLLANVFERQAPCGWRDAVPHAPVDLRSSAEVRLVRKTVENMVMAGELVAVGQAKAAGSRAWHTLYEPAAWQTENEPGVDQMREDSLCAIGAITSAWGPVVT